MPRPGYQVEQRFTDQREEVTNLLREARETERPREAIEALMGLHEEIELLVELMKFRRNY